MKFLALARAVSVIRAADVITLSPLDIYEFTILWHIFPSITITTITIIIIINCMLLLLLLLLV